MDLFEELLSLEPIFHRAEHGTTRADFERMTAADFWEVGASGARYSRAEVLDSLEQRHSRPHVDQWQVSDFACREISRPVHLVTYTLTQGDRITRWATLWERAPGGWRAIYHQGTLAPA